MIDSPLPAEFEALTGQVFNVRRKSPNEYSSSCPFCKDGNDRFVMRLDNNRPRGWCRVCSELWWPEDDREWTPPTRQEQLQAVKVKELDALERKAAIETELQRIRQRKQYLQWHLAMDDVGKRQWAINRGIPAEFQDFWKLGYNQAYTTADKWTTPALTIPCFDNSWQVTQVYFRLEKLPVNGRDKYRQTFGLDPSLFIADPDYPLKDQVIVVEGQIKAQHVFKALLDHSLFNASPMQHYGFNVVAVPTCRPNPSILKPLANAKRIILMLDPDTYDKPKGQPNATPAHDRMVTLLKT